MSTDDLDDSREQARRRLVIALIPLLDMTVQEGFPNDALILSEMIRTLLAGSREVLALAMTLVRRKEGAQ